MCLRSTEAQAALDAELAELNKNRDVPESKVPATNSLRVENFLRPFREPVSAVGVVCVCGVFWCDDSEC